MRVLPLLLLPLLLLLLLLSFVCCWFNAVQRFGFFALMISSGLAFIQLATRHTFF